jgi:hypothetical protein
MLRGAFFFFRQGIKEKREDEMSILWEWIRATRVFGEKWEDWIRQWRSYRWRIKWDMYEENES